MPASERLRGSRAQACNQPRIKPASGATATSGCDGLSVAPRDHLFSRISLRCLSRTHLPRTTFHTHSACPRPKASVCTLRAYGSNTHSTTLGRTNKNP